MGATIQVCVRRFMLIGKLSQKWSALSLSVFIINIVCSVLPYSLCAANRVEQQIKYDIHLLSITAYLWCFYNDWTSGLPSDCISGDYKLANESAVRFRGGGTSVEGQATVQKENTFHLRLGSPG